MAISKQTTSIVKLLRRWIDTRLDSSGVDWVESRCDAIRAGVVQNLYLGFGLVSRKIPKVELALNEQELRDAESARSGWQPESWSLHDAVRTLFVLEYAGETESQFVTMLDRLFATGEVHELVALYQAIGLFPYPEQHRERAAEGIRTNMQCIFCALAHDNSYPSEQLEEGMWNQMVLKCLFIGAALHPVVGLDSRVNRSLSQMLCDYAHERWAASRTISPELWRCVRPEMTATAINDLQRVLEQGNEIEQQAAVLSLSKSLHPQVSSLLEKMPNLLKQVEAGTLTWNHIYRSL